MAGVAAVLESAGEITPRLCNASHCSSDLSNHLSTVTLPYTSGIKSHPQQLRNGIACSSSLPVVPLMKQMTALHRALHFNSWLPGMSPSCCSLVWFTLKCIVIFNY